MPPRVYNWHNRELRIVSAVPGAGPWSVPVSGNSTNPGLYPGNPSLPREVRDKILSTFKHTLTLFQEGKTDDCLIGCDFILKMDPRFSPARRLLEKAKNPAADVDLIELEAIVRRSAGAHGQAGPRRTPRSSWCGPSRATTRGTSTRASTPPSRSSTALPGNVHAVELIEKARKRKKRSADFEGARTPRAGSARGAAHSRTPARSSIACARSIPSIRPSLCSSGGSRTRGSRRGRAGRGARSSAA